MESSPTPPKSASTIQMRRHEDSVMGALFTALIELRQDFNAHAGNEEGMRREWQAILAARSEDKAMLQSLIAGQQAILMRLDDGHARMDKMQEELGRNTAITSDIRDVRTTWATIRRALLWIGPVIVVLCGIAYGVWQVSTVARDIGAIEEGPAR